MKSEMASLRQLARLLEASGQMEEGGGAGGGRGAAGGPGGELNPQTLSGCTPQLDSTPMRTAEDPTDPSANPGGFRDSQLAPCSFRDNLKDTGTVLQEGCSVRGCVCPKGGVAWTGLFPFGVDTERLSFSRFTSSPGLGRSSGVCDEPFFGLQP